MRTQYEITVIIPTFNEEVNIAGIIEAVYLTLSTNKIHGEILVVDDESRDKTIKIVQDLTLKYNNLKIIVRHSDHGLSQSVVEGFRQANSDIFMVIDADFSHPPCLIPHFYDEIKKGADVVIGSRYTHGGGIKQWPLKRRVLSLGATGLGRILFPEVTDPVSGFFALRREVIEGYQLRPRGYKILMEVLGKGQWKSIIEIPFTFTDRQEGESKLSFCIISDFAKQILNIIAYSFVFRNNHVWNEWKKLTRFGLVGLSGVFVNTGLLYLFTEYLGLYYLIASGIAIEISILNNFLLNDCWTFKIKDEPDLYIQNWFHRFFSFQCVSIVGLLINMGILYFLTDFFGIYYLISNFIGILIVFFWNYLVNRNLTWKAKLHY
ncbi:glycosyltransferase family 2 protein [Methanosarcina hadiensis]|uniref:glycosyltransferase n=1 Tax=Methanosarcina hadiensis TaxID=3078083 RepID=UPI003977B675